MLVAVSNLMDGVYARRTMCMILLLAKITHILGLVDHSPKFNLTFIAIITSYTLSGTSIPRVSPSVFSQGPMNKKSAYLSPLDDSTLNTAIFPPFFCTIPAKPAAG